jgi:hypothetical protein
MRYCSLREVTYRAQGYPQRGYAKWLVLGFLWAKLSQVLRTSSLQEAYIKLLERWNVDVENHLWGAIDNVFVASLNYWRKNRGKGAKALDPSTFFRNGLPPLFVPIPISQHRTNWLNPLAA